MNSIYFDSLKRKAIREFPTDVMYEAGSFLYYNFVQMRDGNNPVSSHNFRESELFKQVSSAINNWDIRILDSFCKAFPKIIPSWMNRGYFVEYTEKGFLICQLPTTLKK